MSFIRGTVGISPAAFAWIKSCVDETSLQAFSMKTQIPPPTVRKMLRGDGVRPSTAFRVEALVPTSTVDVEKSELEVLLELKAIVVDLRAQLAPILAERAAEIAARAAA